MKIAKKRVKKVLKEASSENEREIFGKTEKKEKTLKTEEDLNEIEELSKIKKDSKILLEVKQNNSLTTLFSQIKKSINEFKLFLPNEKYYFFGFVNEASTKRDSEEKDFIKRKKIGNVESKL